MMTEEQKQALIKHIEMCQQNKTFFDSVQEFTERQRQINEIALAALTQPASPALKLPVGWRLMPDEPTEEMMRAMYQAQDMWPSAHCDNMRETQMSFARPRYIAALATSPKAPSLPHTAPIEPTGGAEWVKCSERMPKQHQSNRYVPLNLLLNERTVAQGGFDGGEFWIEGVVVNNVTRWMPLPAAPEE